MRFFILKVGWQSNADGISWSEDYLLWHYSIFTDVGLIKCWFFVDLGLEVIDHLRDGLDEFVDLGTFA